MTTTQHRTSFVFDFTEGSKDQTDLLGGKGAGLAEMTRLGLPVPPGFTITTTACRAYLTTGEIPPGLSAEVAAHLRRLEHEMGRALGDADDPLLVSVRSGAKYSMPGMMETILDIGLNDRSVHGLAKHSGDDHFAWDSYRRLLQMYALTVLDVPDELLQAAMAPEYGIHGVTTPEDLLELFVSLLAHPAGQGAPSPLRFALALHHLERNGCESQPYCETEQRVALGDARTDLLRSTGPGPPPPAREIT